MSAYSCVSAKSVRKTAIAALAAMGLVALPSGPLSGPAAAQAITFQEVLAAPDDVALNVEYARQQVATGRLQQAAAALERVLLQNPNYDSARLFYGVVLYRLGDLKGAVRELEKLEGRELTPTQEQDRLRYLALAQDGSKILRFSARYTLGARLDSNPGRFSESAIAAGLAEEDADAAFTGSSRFRVERDLQNGRGDYLFFQSNAFINEFFDTDTADLIATRAKAGAKFHGNRFTVTPYGFIGTSYLQHERFRSQYGGGIDTSFTLSSQVEAFLEGRALYDDYRVTDFSAIGDLRDGWQYRLAGGFRWRPMDTQIFKLKVHGTDKDADFNGYSYDEAGVRLTSLTLFGEGRYLALTAAYTTTEYDAPDGVLSAAVARDDERYYARAAVGAPLATIFGDMGELPDGFGDIIAQIGVSYTDQESNIPLLDYSNISADILFTKRFTF